MHRCKFPFQLAHNHTKSLIEQPRRHWNCNRSGSGRMTDNPHFTRRWPFGRITAGLATIREYRAASL